MTFNSHLSLIELEFFIAELFCQKFNLKRSLIDKMRVINCFESNLVIDPLANHCNALHALVSSSLTPVSEAFMI